MLITVTRLAADVEMIPPLIVQRRSEEYRSDRHHRSQCQRKCGAVQKLLKAQPDGTAWMEVSHAKTFIC
jgi:hypothetical protein